MSKGLFLLLLLFSSACLLAQGANEGFVSDGEVTRHLKTHIDPKYPPIAVAAHVQGSVLLHADVDEAGAVTKVEVIGGPPMLRGAAEAAVKQWAFTPFEVDGKVAAVKIAVSVPFSLGIPAATEKSDSAIGQAYFPKDDECRAASRAGHWDDAVKLCEELNTIASRFPDVSLRSNEIRAAHQEYGEALLFHRELPKALEQFEASIVLAQKYLKPTDAEYATAFYWRAFAEQVSGDRTAADADYQAAESSYRKAMVNLPSMQTMYAKYLAHTLSYHALLLDQTGRKDEAVKMRDEAKSLDPNVKLVTGGN
jgi:TonB family protein